MLTYIIIFVLVFIVFPGLKIVKQYEKGVVFRFGRIVSVKEPGLNWIIPYVDRIRKVDLRIVTLPVPTQKIITKDNLLSLRDFIQERCQ